MIEYEIKEDLKYLIDNVPIIFKYMNISYGKYFLKNFHLTIKNPSIFNDPYDCYPGLIKFSEINDSYRKVIINENYSTFNRQQRRIQLKKFKKTSNIQVCETYQRLFPEVLKNQGVSCFSEIYDNLLMWSHYSDSHSGICVGFDLLNLFNSLKKSMYPETGILRVKYTKDLKPIEYFQNSKLALLHCLRTKSIDWIYEKEVRIILAPILFDHTKKINFNLEPTAIKSIYLGNKIFYEDEKYIFNYCKNFLPHIRLSKMELENNSFQLYSRQL